MYIFFLFIRHRYLYVQIISLHILLCYFKLMFFLFNKFRSARISLWCFGIVFLNFIVPHTCRVYIKVLHLFASTPAIFHAYIYIFFFLPSYSSSCSCVFKLLFCKHKNLNKMYGLFISLSFVFVSLCFLLTKILIKIITFN